MNLAALELWIVLQVALEAVLVVLMIALFLKIRKMRSGRNAELPPEVQSAFEEFLTRSEQLSATFTKTLNEKKEISINLLLQLERKINQMRRQLDEVEEGLKGAPARKPSLSPQDDEDKANPAAPENRALVIKLAERGLRVEEIARRARLHRGEVELILDLEKQLKA